MHFDHLIKNPRLPRLFPVKARFDRRSGRKLNRILIRLGLAPIPSNDIPALDEITLSQYAAAGITEGHGAHLIAGGDRLRFRTKFQYWLTMHPDATY